MRNEIVRLRFLPSGDLTEDANNAVKGHAEDVWKLVIEYRRERREIIDYQSLSREHIVRYPKIRAALAR